MMVYRVSWSVVDPFATEDDVVNGVREAVARAGFQVGDCVVIVSNHSCGEALVQIGSEVVDDCFCFGGVSVEVEFSVGEFLDIWDALGACSGL